jgi:acyl carrier protein
MSDDRPVCADNTESWEQRAIRVIRAAVTVSRAAVDVKLSTPIASLGLDSLERLELALDLEDEFAAEGLELPVDLHPGTEVGLVCLRGTVGELIVGITVQLERLRAARPAGAR